MQISTFPKLEIMEEQSLEASSVLVVDDEPSIRETLRAYLERLGIPRVETAENGKTALAALNRRFYDYVFMDLMMPEMSGMEALKELRQNGRPSSVIVMTGYPSMEKVIQAIQNGASDFLVKPFRLQDIKVSMERIHRLHGLMKRNWFLSKELEQKEQVEMLNDQLQRKIREKTTLYDIIDSLSKINRPEEIYDYMVEKAADACDASRACFLLRDPSRSSLLSFTEHGAPELRPGLQIAVETDAQGRQVVDAGFVRRFLSDGNLDPVFVDEATCGERLVAVPFRIRKEPFGLLLAAGKKKPDAFGKEEEFILNFLTERAALNIENMALYDSLKENLFATLGALVSAIEARDLYTQQHSERVTRIALEIAVKLGCSGEDLRRLEASGPLHDIGKIGIDDQVLKKAGRLSAEEFERIKAHPLIGVNIVAPLGLDAEELSIIRNHHERWDGKGYPDGLEGKETPQLARILAVADAFDAMSSDRAYRKALPLQACLRELKENSGAQFDPEVVHAALELFRSNPDLVAMRKA